MSHSVFRHARCVGLTGRELTNGAWDGWSYDNFVDGGEPGEPVPATVPEPASLAGLSIIGAGFVLRRRRRTLAIAPLFAGVAFVVANGTSAQAAYIYNPNDFATQVVSSTGFPANPSASQYYSSPDAVLGRPALKFKDIFGADPNAFHRVKLIEPAYATGLSGERLITTFNAGQSVTVKMGRTVNNDPNNAFGIDLIVYGNSFFVAGGGGFVGDNTNLNTTTVGGVFAENVRVSVSPDNVSWYSYPQDATHTGDGYYPTNSYLWNRNAAAWTDDEADPTKPVDPSIAPTLSGKTSADVLDLYNGAAGGTGFDLADSGFSFINYVRFDGLTGYSGGEIDAVAAVNPVPEPATLATLGIGALALMRRRRR
ncbi:MAG TPA: PEP-CTERM sorting domain-containing protein [Tepidisphaeraceae bacterium]|nr:PEP-CTERM sorting domain-containing protein [Tepidisphaeraceae bacterium]